MVESGWFYGTFVDPVLNKMRERAANKIEPGDKVLDVACGTGAQVFEFAKKASVAVGVDLSESMVDWAKKQKGRRDSTNTEFYILDAEDLKRFSDNEFDVANLSLALHQFPPDKYPKIINEMKRVAKNIMVIDYAVPLPKNYVGFGSKIAEFFAGKEHHKNFIKYYKLGGLNAILSSQNFTIVSSEYFAKNTFQLTVCTWEQ